MLFGFVQAGVQGRSTIWARASFPTMWPALSGATTHSTAEGRGGAMRTPSSSRTPRVVMSPARDRVGPVQLVRGRG